MEAALNEQQYCPDREVNFHCNPVRSRPRPNCWKRGATVPFISRYRKELTGSLDEVAVTAIRDRLTQLHDLDARRQTILASM